MNDRVRLNRRYIASAPRSGVPDALLETAKVAGWVLWGTLVVGVFLVYALVKIALGGFSALLRT